MVDIKVSVTIPDKEPFEGKATQKQKQYLWTLGYQDEEAIADLGKKQASAIIDQLKRAHDRTEKITDGIVTIILAGVVLVVCIIVIIRSERALFEVPSYIFAFLALVKLLAGAIKTLWHKLMLSKQTK
jgi:hypothetical protein